MATNPPAVTPTPTSAPTNKAVAATGGSAIGAAVSTIVLYLLDPNGHLPQEVKVAITTLVTAIITLAAAYYTPPGASEAVVQAPDGSIKTARMTLSKDRGG